MTAGCVLSSKSHITAKTSAGSGRTCNSSITMLAGMMWSLASQQRRLITGHKHISFSRDTGASASLLRTQATTTEHSSRRRRRPTEADQQPQQQPLSQTKEPQTAAKKQLDRSSNHNAGSRADQQHKQAREQITQQSASSLGLVRASDVAGRSEKQQLSSSQLPWNHPLPQEQLRSAHSPVSSTDDSASTLSDGTLSSSSYAASSSRRSSSSSSDGSFDGGTSSSSSSSSVPASLLGSLQLSDEEHAIIAATNRLSRFMDFRERCALEVVNKLTDLGCDKQFAYQVLRRMQETGLQDDARFAEMYARGQWVAKAQAPAKIAYELRMRRVAQEHIDAALEAVFGDSKQFAGMEPSDEAQEASWSQLVEVCRRRVESTQGQPQQKRRAKLATWLQRRGHTLSTAFRMFDALGI